MKWNPGGLLRSQAAAVAARFLPLSHLGGALLLGGLLLGSCGDVAAPARYRGVVVVVLDTVRADRCSLFGHSAPTSPSLARFAQSARTYEKCWSPSPWTSPSHASLFTAQLPDRHGLRRSGSMYLMPGADTLAGRMAAAGYATAGFSGSPNASAMVGLDQGFQHFDLLPGDAVSGEPRGPGESGYAENIAQQTLAWIGAQRADGRRHLAFMNVFDAHLPYDPPLDAAQRFAGHRPFQLAEWGRRVDHPFPLVYALGMAELSRVQLETLSELYDAELSVADRAVQTLLDGLDRMGARDDTVVVVLADHGENLGDHGLLDHMLSLNASVLHVPLVIRAPGVLDDGARRDALVRVEDVAPTVLELCGLEPFAEADGLSLLDDNTSRVSHAWLDPMLDSQVARVREIVGGADVRPTRVARRSVYDGRYHLIAESGAPDRLYDVQEDPGELTDLAADRPDDVRRLRGLIDERARALAAESALSPR
jgi:arylsulfatase A-like enzyme